MDLDGVAVGAGEALDVSNGHASVLACGAENVLRQFGDYEQVFFTLKFPLQNMSLLFQRIQEKEDPLAHIDCKGHMGVYGYRFGYGV